MTKILYHDNNIYHDIVIFFSFKKCIILKSLIPYNFHNPCHQCQYQTNTSLKREREKNPQKFVISMNGRQNEYWNASPLRAKSGSNTLLHWVFSFSRLLSQDLNRCVYEDTCKDRDSDAYKCVYVIVQSRQKRKGALLSHRKRRCTHIALFVFQQLQIGCFKTAVLINAWPCYRCSPSFRNELVVLHLFLSLLHVSWWVACKDRSHPNDEKVLP